MLELGKGTGNTGGSKRTVQRRRWGQEQGKKGRYFTQRKKNKPQYISPKIRISESSKKLQKQVAKERRRRTKKNLISK